MNGYSTVDVSRLLDIPKHKILYLRKTGRLPEVLVIGGMLVFTPKDVCKIADMFGVEVPRFKEQE